MASASERRGVATGAGGAGAFALMSDTCSGLSGTTVANADGPTRWWTDPYGGNASAQPFPGAVCQLVAPIETAPRPPARTRVFGRNLDHDAQGVHAPN